MSHTDYFDEGFLKKERSLLFMRTHVVLLTLFLAALASPTIHAEPPSDGESVTISEQQTWSEGGVLDGMVTIESGSSVEVTATYSVETGSVILVEEGATLQISNGASLESNEVSAGRFLTLGSQLHLNFGDIAETGLLQIHLDAIVPATSQFNATLLETTVDVAQINSQIIEFNDVPLDGTTLDVNFSIFTFSDVKVTKAIAIYNGGEQLRLNAEEIEATNSNLWWYNAGFDMVVHGELSVVGSTLRGANITCFGTCIIDGTTLIGSAPIDVPTTGSLSVSDSTIFGSRADEDIILHDDAEITYLNSQGTGGFTDAWVRLLSSRTIYTNIPNGSVDIFGLGYGASNWNDLTDDQGVLMLVEEGGNEHRRMIEWMDGEGAVHQEDASITLSISSNWGTFSTTIDAPMTPVGYLNLSLPYITVDSVEASEVTGTVNESIGLMMTVSNSGDVAVTANFRCYVNGEDADTAPSTITVSIPQDESVKVPISWWANSDGAQQLNCKPFLPSVLEPISDLVVDENGATSEEVSWIYAEESQETPLLIYLVVLAAFVIGGLFLSRKRASPEEKEFSMDQELYHE
ncbi:MAG: hypothetical protein VW230_05610 [Candidatus Poseidoniales archaeon]